MNIKKGANAFGFSISMLICGAIFALAALVNPYVENSTSTTLRIVHFFTSQFGDTGMMMIAAGGIWLLFSFAGSFFSFNTDDMILKVWMWVMVTMVVAMIYIFGIAFSGISVLKNPWTIYVLGALVILMYLLVSLNFFYYAARKEEKQPDTLGRLLNKLTGVVVLPRNKREH